ncbi:MAG: iron-containing alcohol dehydrogenase [Christensenellales bacterium]
MINFVSNREVYFGNDAINNMPAILKWYDKKKVFLVVYRETPTFVQDIKQLLNEAEVPFTVYVAGSQEPDLDIIDKGTEMCVKEKCDSVIAVGGGSSIDAAKMMAMMATNGGCTENYQIDGRAVTQQPLLFIAVPTTSGTGAEATKVSVIFNQHKGYKKAAYDNSMIATSVILDPKITVSLPPKKTAATGMDAITHAIESYTSLNANVFSKMYSLKAVELLFKSMVKAYEEPENLEARADMLLGSYFAGLAISAGTCLAHIVGQPLGAIYGIPHGDACAIFLIPSMRMNKDYCLDKYADIARAAGIDCGGKTDEEAFDALVALLEDISGKINAPSKVTDYIEKEKIDVDFAVENVATSMGHIKHNPRPVSREVFKELLLSVM